MDFIPCQILSSCKEMLLENDFLGETVLGPRYKDLDFAVESQNS